MISRSDQDMLHPFRRHQADTCLIPGRRVICSAPANRHAIPEHLPADATCTRVFMPRAEPSKSGLHVDRTALTNMPSPDLAPVCCPSLSLADVAP